MTEPTRAPGVIADADRRQIEDVVARLTRRYAHKAGMHRDVIEAAVRSGWAQYNTAKVTTYRAILAERAALVALQPWFGDPTDLGLDAEIVDDIAAPPDQP